VPEVGPEKRIRNPADAFTGRGCQPFRNEQRGEPENRSSHHAVGGDSGGRVGVVGPKHPRPSTSAAIAFFDLTRILNF
jgi:hypothetical protein